MRVTLFHNLKAGRDATPKEEILAALRRHGYTVNYCNMQDDAFDDAFQLPADLLIAAGGDGTVGKVALRLLNRATPIGILPLGTANNIAHSLGIEGDIDAIVRGWADGAIQPYDIGLATGPWETMPFIEAVGIGAFADTMSTPSDGNGEDRVIAGRRAFAKALEEAEPLETAVHIDGTPLLGDWLAVEALNPSRSGPALWLAPHAHSGDGLLDVLCISEEQRPSVIDWLAAPDTTAPPFEAIRAHRVAFEWDAKRYPLRIDDELVEGFKKKGPHAITAELQPVPLQFLLPKGAQVKNRQIENQEHEQRSEQPAR